MILFVAILATLCIAMLLMTIGCAFRKPDVKITCAQAEHCCQRPREADRKRALGA